MKGENLMKFISNMFFLTSAFFLFACSAGNNTNPMITASVASGSSCVDMANNTQCSIQLTYNANSLSGLTLGNTSLNNQFSLGGLTNCPTPSGSSNQQCNVTLTYNKTSGGNPVPKQNIAFTLGAVTSNSILYSGQ